MTVLVRRVVTVDWAVARRLVLEVVAKRLLRAEGMVAGKESWKTSEISCSDAEGSAMVWRLRVLPV